LATEDNIKLFSEIINLKKEELLNFDLRFFFFWQQNSAGGVFSSKTAVLFPSSLGYLPPFGSCHVSSAACCCWVITFSNTKKMQN
jgi:hypothetical protein